MGGILSPHQRYSAAYLDVVIWSTDWESYQPKSAIGLEEAGYLGYTTGRGLIKPQVHKGRSH